MGALLTWDPRSDISWRWGENIRDFGLVEGLWPGAELLLATSCPAFVLGCVGAPEDWAGRSTALLGWGEGWEWTVRLQVGKASFDEKF